MKIHLDNLKKSYGQREILKGISCTFEGGKLYVIKGVSGCGKTTLLNILGCTDLVYEGLIAFDSEEMVSTGYLFQKSLLLTSLTVRENLEVIVNDINRIQELCAELHISDLLERKPEELSGGERQRIAIARAILRNPCLLLCDEPTASLDYENSNAVAELIASQKDPDRVIIVATHDSCFDTCADEIIQLDYGVFSDITKKEVDLGHEYQIKNTEFTASSASDSITKKKQINAFIYAQKRHPHMFSFGALFPLVFGLLLVLLITTVKTNYATEAVRFMKRSYPMDMFNYSEGITKAYPEQLLDQTIFYDDYETEENGIKGFYLPEKRASIFMINGMILAGKYPEAADQVLLTPECMDLCFHGEEFQDVIGKTMECCGMSFTISGVVASASDKNAEKHYFNDVYYRRKVTGPAFFIPYEMICKIGTLTANEFRTAYYPNLADSPEAVALIEEYRGFSMPNQYYANIQEAQGTIDRASKIISILTMICTLIAGLFMSSIVSEELYYRRKEIGYLQIFGVQKRKVSRFVFSEYLLKLAAALGLSYLVYLLLIVGYRLLFGTWINTDITTIIILTIGISAVYLLSAFLGIWYFLKKGVITLIN